MVAVPYREYFPFGRGGFPRSTGKKVKPIKKRNAIRLRRRAMASNFRIFCHQNSDNLHLKLMGDFDGTSPYESLETLRK
jgi:hypothetical protein